MKGDLASIQALLQILSGLAYPREGHIATQTDQDRMQTAYNVGAGCNMGGITAHRTAYQLVEGTRKQSRALPSQSHHW